MAYKGIWFLKNRTCWIAAAVSLAAMDSDIECCSSKWMVVGTGDIAVTVKGRRVGHVRIVNQTDRDPIT